MDKEKEKINYASTIFPSWTFFNTNSLVKLRLPSDIKTPSCMLIYKDTTVIVVPSDNQLAIEIVSQAVADSYMAYFEEYWKNTGVK